MADVGRLRQTIYRSVEISVNFLHKLKSHTSPCMHPFYTCLPCLMVFAGRVHSFGDSKCIGTIGKKYLELQVMSFIERFIMSMSCHIMSMSFIEVYYTVSIFIW